MDRAIIVYINLGSRLGHDTLDCLAPRTDQEADLIGMNLYGFDSGRILTQLLAWRGDRDGHDIEYFHSRIPGLENRLRHNSMRNAGKLQVQLKTGNTLSSTAKLEVHIAEMVLRPDDIRKRGIALQLLSFIFSDQSHGNTSHRFSDRSPGVHQRHHTCANTSHRSRAI